MTINCDRWKQIAFSAEYYRAGPEGAGPRGPRSTATSHRRPRRQEGLRADGLDQHGQPDSTCTRRRSRSAADTHTGCLVLFQQGEVDAITGDDTVLAGFAAQDPYAKVVGAGVHRRALRPRHQRRTTSTSCGSSTACSSEMRADGAWTASYDDRGSPTPSARRRRRRPPVYGRDAA